MKCVYFFVLAIFTAQNVLAEEEEDWISTKKKDICPALHEKAICTDNLINFDDVAEAIEKLGKEDKISNDQVDAGKDASKCGDPLKKAFCSSDASPLCLEDRTSGDDSAEKRVCKELYETCPSLESQKSLNYTEECAAYLRREFSDMTCESVGADFKEGGCPRPARKMPELYIQVYKTQSDAMKPLSDLLDGANEELDKVWDANCLKTVRELPCMPIYCSETDESIVQIKNKRKDCDRAMECVSKSTEKLNSWTAEVAKGLVDGLRDAIKDSCETIIEGFEDLANPSTGGVSSARFSISLTLLAIFLCLKMFW